MDNNPIKALICDDSVLIRKKLKSALETCGISDIMEAEDGQVAVDLCKEHRPDIVFLDIVMPNKDGLEALKEILEHDRTIKVVMASSVGTQANLIKALKEGAYSFIQKPVTQDAMNELIQKFRSERGEA